MLKENRCLEKKALSQKKPAVTKENRCLEKKTAASKRKPLSSRAQSRDLMLRQAACSRRLQEISQGVVKNRCHLSALWRALHFLRKCEISRLRSR